MHIKYVGCNEVQGKILQESNLSSKRSLRAYSEILDYNPPPTHTHFPLYL